MSDFICGLASMAGVDVDWCKGVVQGKKIDTPVGAACTSSPTGTITKDIVGDAANETLDAQGLTDARDVSHTNPFDKDNDGYTDIAYKDQYCVEYKPGMEVSKKLCDCNDNIASINPGAQEICNDIDDNCNGIVDEGCVLPEDIKADVIEEVKIEDAKVEIPFLDVYEEPETKEAPLCQIAFSSIYTPGFPGSNTPIITDLDGDGKQEVIVADSGAPWWNIDALRLFVYGNTSNAFLSKIWETIVGNQANGDSLSNIVIGDLNNDGYKEVVADTGYSLHAIQWGGMELDSWPKAHPKKIRKLAISDLDGDGNLEIIGSGKNALFVFNNQGDLLQGWPKDMTYNPWPYPLLIGDIDGDTAQEIITTSPTEILIWRKNGELVQKFPVDKTFLSDASIAPRTNLLLGDVNHDGDLEIVSYEIVGYGQTSEQPYIKIYNSDAEILSSWQVGGKHGKIKALGDINADQNLEIAYLTSMPVGNDPFKCYQEVYLYEISGETLEGWPISGPNNDFSVVGGTLLIADINSDNNKEIIPVLTVLQGSDGFSEAHIFDSEAELLGILTYEEGPGSIAIGDIDGDGKIDIAGVHFEDGEGSGLAVWSCSGLYDPSKIDWGKSDHDPQGTWNYETPVE